MKDDASNAPKKGECGTVTMVDDMGTVHMMWDSGSQLGLIPDEDIYHVVEG